MGLCASLVQRVFGKGGVKRQGLDEVTGLQSLAEGIFFIWPFRVAYGFVAAGKQGTREFEGHEGDFLACLISLCPVELVEVRCV